MTESSIVSISATVLTYSNENKKWILVGTSEGQSKVQLYHNTATNKYRIVAWKLADREVVLNYPLTANMRYHEASKTFHQWKSANQVYGLSFVSEDEAKKFSTCVKNVLQELVSPNYDFPPPAPATNHQLACPQSASPQLPKRGIPLNAQAAVNSPLSSPSTPPLNLLPQQPVNGFSNAKEAENMTTSPMNSPYSPTGLSIPPVSAPVPPPGPPVPPTDPIPCLVADGRSPLPPPSGGPPPPPPPPSGGLGPRKPPSAGGGLAAALQGKKLRQAKDSEATPTPFGGKMSMMDEMATRLKKRKDQGPENPPKLNIPDIKPRPVSPPKIASPLPSSQVKVDTKPTLLRKPIVGIPPKTIQQSSQISTDEVQNIKNAILEEIRKEFMILKEELLKEMKR